MGRTGYYTAQQFIDAIPKSGGIVSTIARRVGCAWHTAKKYIDNYATVAKAYADECEGVLDAAESVVLEGIREKDISVSKWYLTMKGRRRGYAPTQRQEVTGEDGGPIEIDDKPRTKLLSYLSGLAARTGEGEGDSEADGSGS